MSATIELVPHLDAGERMRWRGVQDERPLSELGVIQAGQVAEALVGAGRIDALYSSPALRCLQSLQPLADRLRLGVNVDTALHEKQLGEDTASMARRGWQCLQEIAEANPGGRVVACSHGDLIPAVAALVTREHHLPYDHRLERRGQWFTLALDGPRVRLSLNEPPHNFPSDWSG